MTVTEDDNRGPKILGVLWALTGLTTLIVAARMLIRGKLLKNFGPDDWLIAVSMVDALLVYIVFLYADEPVYGLSLLRRYHSQCDHWLWQACCLSKPG